MVVVVVAVSAAGVIEVLVVAVIVIEVVTAATGTNVVGLANITELRLMLACMARCCLCVGQCLYVVGVTDSLSPFAGSISEFSSLGGFLSTQVSNHSTIPV